MRIRLSIGVALFLTAMAGAAAQSPAPTWQPYIAEFNFATGEPVGSPRRLPVPPPSIGLGLFAVAWSPDGRVVLYVSAPAAQARRVIVLYAPDTGEAAELRPQLKSFDRVQWLPDGLSLTVIGMDLDDRTGVFQVDARTGAVERLSEKIERDERPAPLPDGVTPIDGQMPDVLAWAPDGASFIGRTSVSAASGDSQPAYWWVPIKGKPRRIDWHFGSATAFASHGSRIVFSASR
jgi:hypothetical protein